MLILLGLKDKVDPPDKIHMRRISSDWHRAETWTRFSLNPNSCSKRQDKSLSSLLLEILYKLKKKKREKKAGFLLTLYPGGGFFFCVWQGSIPNSQH